MLDIQEALLVQLMEELSELSKEAAELSIRTAKALRFGLEEVQPGHTISNRLRLLAEYADVVGVAEALGFEADPKLVAEKREKIEKFLRYSKDLGRVTPT